MLSSKSGCAGSCERTHGVLHVTSPTISQDLQPLVKSLTPLLVGFALLQALMGLSARPTTGPGDAVTATLAFPMAVKVNKSGLPIHSTLQHPKQHNKHPQQQNSILTTAAARPGPTVTACW